MTNTRHSINSQEQLDDQPVVALPAQYETLVRFTADNDLEVEQQDPQDTEADRVLIAGDNVRDFLAYIVLRFHERHGNERTVDLLDHLIHTTGLREDLLPVQNMTYFGEPRKPVEIYEIEQAEWSLDKMKRVYAQQQAAAAAGDAAPVTSPRPEHRNGNAERQRRYRERKRRNASAGDGNAQDRNGPDGNDHNAAPLQPELLST